LKQTVVTLIDYGRGNLFSVRQALEKCGAAVTLTSSHADIAAATHLVLPGVGAFADGMQGLRELGLIEPIRAYAASNRPFLGICLGMQMMLDLGLEFGSHQGLGLIPGTVSKIQDTDSEGRPQKIPHIGWSRLVPGDSDREKWQSSILAGVGQEDTVYFVHSFEARPENPASALAYCNFGGRRICAVIRSGHVYGCQFHPEKSGSTGLRILRNFVALP
jgi:glutamine amidotransferase